MNIYCGEIDTGDMPKNTVPALVVMLALVSAMCLSQSAESPAPPKTTTTTLEPVPIPENAVILEDGTVISLEIARTDAEQMRGLMYREGIGENEGMLFVFERERRYEFWMKNVKFPIDMLWLDSGFKVVHIERGVPPCSAEPCPRYAPTNPGKYVLELKANLTRKRGIAVGDVLDVRV